MTVRELWDHLSKLNPNAEVRVVSEFDNLGHHIESVSVADERAAACLVDVDVGYCLIDIDA